MKSVMMAAVLGFVAAVCWPTAAEAGEREKVQVTGKVNLNQATAEQLELLNGVGEKTARDILAYREKRRFTRIEDLVKVKGIGRKKFAKVKDHLAVTGETTLRAEAPKDAAEEETPGKQELAATGQR